MKELGTNGATSHIEEVSILREVKRAPRWARPALIVVVILVFVASLWPAYQKYVRPRLDQRTLDAALRTFGQQDEHGRKFFEAMKTAPRERMLLASYDNLKDDAANLEGARAALDLAISEGSSEAGLELGKALRDGVFGDKDNVAALKRFERVKRSIDAGVRVGDPVALYSHAIMLSEGLGVEVDRTAAAAAIRRAAYGLSGWRLEEVARAAAWGYGVFTDGRDQELASRLASRLMDEGNSKAYWIGASACAQKMTAEQKASESREDFDRRYERDRRCYIAWSERGAKAGSKDAMSDHAAYLLEDGDTLGARTWFETAGSNRDARANYLHGLVQAIVAQDPAALVAGAKSMWSARLELLKGDAVHRVAPYSVLHRLKKVLGNEGASSSRRNVVIALLIQAALEGTTEATLEDFRHHDPIEVLFPPRLGSPGSLRALAEVPENRRAASLAAEAIRSNRQLADVVAAESDRARVSSGVRSQANQGSFQPLPVPVAQPDREQQARSGYMPGEPRTATGGLSSFTVDNIAGQHDAVVRLYVNGKKPAARGFYVKRGERFSAASLRPGTYVMRYRLIGSEDTFEAEKEFALTETETDAGRRYSNATVRLSRGPDGNLTTRKVPPEQF